MLTLTDGDEKTLFTKSESLQLELKLNVSPFGAVWRLIGDCLFHYANDVYGDDHVLTVTMDQYDYLLYLHRLTD